MGGRWRLVSAEVKADRYRLCVKPLVRAAEQIALLAKSLGFSPREVEVFCWMSMGKSNPEITIILGVACSTVRKHLEIAFRRLQVEHRHAAALTHDLLWR